MIARLFACVSLALSTTAVAAEPRQPTGKWIVDYADKMCVLQREYGTPAERLTVAIQADPMGKYTGIFLFDKLTQQNAAHVPVTIGFGPGPAPVESQMETFNVRTQGFRFSQTGLKRDELERAAINNVLSFDAKNRISVAFAMPNFAAALKILDECVVDLLATWGFTREMQAAMVKKPEPLKPLHKYVSVDDYPKDAVHDGVSGSNSARYWIDQSGRVGECTIIESSGSKSLDSTLCKVVSRYQFTPALDRAQQPMASIGFVRMKWRMYSFP